MGRVTWRGVTLDERSAQMMDEVARLTGEVYVRPTQGSYSTAVGASAGTHAGGGAIDVHASSLTPAQRSRVVEAMRRVGWAAWLRTPAQSDWPYHVHGVAVGCRDLSPAAAAQVRDYTNGRNGLASGAPDDGPRDHVGVTWETYQRRRDWFAMATKAELREVVEAVMDSRIDEIAARVNRVLGDYNSQGKPTGPNKDDPQLAAAYIRQIRRLVDRS